MQMELQCVGCTVRQIQKVLENADLPAARKLEYMKEILQLLSKIDFSLSPPHVAGILHSRLKEITGISDPYREIKKRSNDIALKLVPKVKDLINNSSNPFLFALKVSIAGNIIDYGAREGVSEEEITHALEESMNQVPLSEYTDLLRCDLEKAENILFIGDNAGEIVFDKLFIEHFPAGKVTYVVRGLPIINDVTLEDANYVGMDKVAKIIDTGEGIPGIDLRTSSDTLKKAFQKADVIILKGQGNLETVIDKNIKGLIKDDTAMYFLLKVKCSMVSEKIRRPLGDIVIMRKPG